MLVQKPLRTQRNGRAFFARARTKRARSPPLLRTPVGSSPASPAPAPGCGCAACSPSPDPGAAAGLPQPCACRSSVRDREHVCGYASLCACKSPVCDREHVWMRACGCAGLCARARGHVCMRVWPHACTSTCMHVRFGRVMACSHLRLMHAAMLMSRSRVPILVGHLCLTDQINTGRLPIPKLYGKNGM